MSRNSSGPRRLSCSGEEHAILFRINVRPSTFRCSIRYLSHSLVYFANQLFSFPFWATPHTFRGFFAFNSNLFYSLCKFDKLRICCSSSSSSSSSYSSSKNILQFKIEDSLFISIHNEWMNERTIERIQHHRIHWQQIKTFLITLQSRILVCCFYLLSLPLSFVYRKNCALCMHVYKHAFTHTRTHARTHTYTHPPYIESARASARIRCGTYIWNVHIWQMTVCVCVRWLYDVRTCKVLVFHSFFEITRAKHHAVYINTPQQFASNSFRSTFGHLNYFGSHNFIATLFLASKFESFFI